MCCGPARLASRPRDPAVSRPCRRRPGLGLRPDGLPSREPGLLGFNEFRDQGFPGAVLMSSWNEWNVCGLLLFFF